MGWLTGQRTIYYLDRIDFPVYRLRPEDVTCHIGIWHILFARSDGKGSKDSWPAQWLQILFKWGRLHTIDHSFL